MKRLFFSVVVMLLCVIASGQIQIPENSTSPIYYKLKQVGIGTLNPVAKLQVEWIDDRYTSTTKYGVYSTVKIADLSQKAYAVYGESIGRWEQFDANMTNIGVAGQASWEATAGDSFTAEFTGTMGKGIGIYGTSTGFLNNYAGYFEEGNVYIKNKLGIGIDSPSEALHVKGNGLFNGGITVNSQAAIQLKLGYGQSIFPTIGFYEATTLKSAIQWDKNKGSLIHFNDEANTALEIAAGIDGLLFHSVQHTTIHKVWHSGNSNNNSTDWMCRNLDVNGSIKAHEIEVTLANMDNMRLNGTLAANNITYSANGQTADHVFEEDYNLRSLNEIETFIKTNKHLPDVPSAKEMEEQGVNLAEMNKLLLQKVEELTLYTIEQEKELREKEERLSSQEERLKKIEALLQKQLEN